MWSFFERLLKPNIFLLTQRQDIKGLVKALEYRRDPAIRGQAASMLGMLNVGTAIHPLIAALLGDSDSTVRSRAATALETYSHQQAIEALIKSALRDNDADVRKASASALGGRLGKDQCVEAFIAALDDPDVVIRSQAAALLKGGANERAMNALIASALRDENMEVRAAAASSALARLDKDQCIEAFIAAIGDADAVIRCRAVKALEKCTDRRFLEAMFSAIRDIDAEVRAAAARTLGRLATNWTLEWSVGRERCLEALKVALSDTHAIVRRSAAGALSEYADTRASAILANAVHDKDTEVRAAAMDALRRACRHPEETWKDTGGADADVYCAVCGAYIRSMCIRAKGAIGHDELNVNIISRRQWRARTERIFAQKFDGPARAQHLN